MSKYDNILIIDNEGRELKIICYASDTLEFYNLQSKKLDNSLNIQYFFSLKYIILKFKLIKEKYCE